MAQLQIPLDDELMIALKMFALKNKTTLKETVTKALKEHIKHTPVPEPAPKTEPKLKKPKPVPEPKKEKEKPKQTSKKGSVNPETGYYERTQYEIETEDDSSKNPDKDDYYLLRKPIYIGNTVKSPFEQYDGVMSWWLNEGETIIYDKYKYDIPFTYQKAGGEMHLPTDDEIKLVEEAYGKPVAMEE